MDCLAFETAVCRGARVFVKSISCDCRPKGAVVFKAGLSVGARVDPPRKEGLAHLFEHEMFEQTRSRTREQIDAQGRMLMQRSFNAMTCFQITVLEGKTSRELLDEAMLLCGEMVCVPVFDPSNHSKEQKIATQEWWENFSSRHEPKLFRRARKNVYFDHPLGRMVLPTGSERSIARISIDDLAEFHKTYCHRGNMILLFVGDIKMEEALRYANLFLQASSAGEREPAPEPLETWPAPKEKEMIIPAKRLGIRGAKQARILVHRVIPRQKDPQVIWLLRSLLRDLVQPVREQLEATYGVSVRLENHPDHHFLELDVKFNPACLSAVRATIENIFRGFEDPNKYRQTFNNILQMAIADNHLFDASLRDIVNIALNDLDEHGRIIPLHESEDVITRTTFDDMRELVLRELGPDKLQWVTVRPE